MDLSAVARQSVSRRVEASASASASRRTEEEEDDDEDLDADEAKALVRAFVKHALDGVRGGERAQYYELLEALEGLEEPRVSQDKLLMLTVLVECVSSLDENAHEDLLRRVLSVSLWRCADDVAALVVEFCVNLVSTHTGSLLQTCLEMLVAGFVPPPGYDLALLERDGRWGPGAASERGGRNPAAPENVGVSASTPPPRPPEAVTAGVVRAVETILTLVPLAASVLRPILLARLPHASAHKNVQTQYLRAAFRLAETGPGAPLRDALLRGVVSHLLQVDVEITWEHIRDPAGGDGDDSSDEDVEDDMDGDGDEDLGDGDAGGGAGIFELDDIEKTIEIEMTRQAAVWERDARARGGHFARARHGTSPTTSSGIAGDRVSGAAIDETADALDSMMETTLAHVDVRIDRGDGRAVADAVLSIFLSTLLPAHTSKFTQFLVFHVCARDAADRAPNAPSALPGLAAVGRESFETRDASSRSLASTAAFGTAHGLAGRIADALIERVTDPHHPPAGRLASAAYLASFLARAAFLPPAFLAAALARTHRWCAATVAAAAHGARDLTSVGNTNTAGFEGGRLARGFGSSFEIADGESGSGSGEGKGADVRRPTSAPEFADASAATLAVFDSACQALMYVLVYRMEDILRAGGAPAEALRALPLRDVLYSRLEPTKTCLPSVVLEFLHRAADARLPGFDDDLVERHKAERRAARSAGDAGENGAVRANGSVDAFPIHAAPPQLRRSGSAGAALGGDLAEAVRQRRPLRMFFPFDPYLLRRSATLLRLPLTYVAWRGEVRQGSERDDEEDDLDVDLDDDDESEPEDESDEEEASGGRGGSRSGSHMGSHGHHSFNSSLPNSLNPRPRKLTRGLLGPQPLFGGRSVSPGSAEAGKPTNVFRSSPKNGSPKNGFGLGASAAAAPPIVGFAAGGVPTHSTFGSGSPGGAPNAPPSPSRLGAPTGSDGGGARPPRVPKRTTR